MVQADLRESLVGVGMCVGVISLTSAQEYIYTIITKPGAAHNSLRPR